MKIFATFIVTLFILFAFQSVSACLCADYSVPTCKTFSDADVVFVGKISKVALLASEKKANQLLDRDYSLRDKRGYVGVEFTVEKSFKGTNEKTIKAYTYIGTSCELEMEQGAKWKISARKDKKSGLLTFSKCDGNFKIEDSTYDTSDLEAFFKGQFNTPILGRVSKKSLEGIENAKVSLTGNSLNLTTVTDKFGWFNFPKTQPGKYKIKVLIPFKASKISDSSKNIAEAFKDNETTYEYEAEVKPNYCDYEYFELVIANNKPPK